VRRELPDEETGLADGTVADHDELDCHWLLGHDMIMSITTPKYHTSYHIIFITVVVMR
jgi:hypothetical protein